MMDYLHFFSIPLIFSISLPLLFFFILATLMKSIILQNPSKNIIPKSYPIFGSFFSILANKDRYVQWTSGIVTATPNLTFTLQTPLGRRIVVTANSAVVEHILKTYFHSYDKGDNFRTALRDFLGESIFNSEGEKWKFQRQLSIHEFNTKSLRRFVETVVDSELSDRLIPILKTAARDGTVLDFQDVLQRFGFDNICRIAFGYDPEYLSPSLSPEKFSAAFGTAVKLSCARLTSFTPVFWKIKRALHVGSEKQLKIAVSQVREFAKKIVGEKKRELERKPLHESSADDLLSRFLSIGHSDEDFVIDMVVAFVLAGRDTTSAALTWFFWLLSNHPDVENEILKEIKEKQEAAVSGYDEVKEMVYSHASLCETMRLYPPVPMDTKAALNDDVLPDGTKVKKGMRVSYHTYAMGRIEKVWGKDWAEFCPERWLERAEFAGKWRFVNKDSYSYPVFQAGPRTCIGKEMAFIQMKRVVAGVLRQFRVVPVAAAEEPVYVADLTSKMKGGFPVRIFSRAG